ncbi:MAG: Lin0512 family protein [Rhodobacteraceae bacterium]|nr:Lin0512 family protein [Paracoccaceae bacterium]
MPHHRLLTELGMGTSLRRGDYTQAAVRAVRDALWHNSINMAELFGFDRSAMQISVELGARHPDRIDTDAVAAAFPYGQVSVRAVPGGLDIPRPDGTGQPTVIVNAAISVAFDMERDT